MNSNQFNQIFGKIAWFKTGYWRIIKLVLSKKRHTGHLKGLVRFWHNYVRLVLSFVMFDQFLYNIVYSFSLVFLFSYFIELWRLELSSRKAWLKIPIFAIPQLFFSPLKSTSSIFIITYTKVFLKECQTIYLYNLVNSLSHYFGNSVIFYFGFWITFMLIRMKKVFFT